MRENRGKSVFVIPRNKKKTETLIYNIKLLILKHRKLCLLNFSTARLLAPIFREFGIYFANLPFE